MDKSKMLEAMYVEATLGIIVADRTGNIVKANPYAHKLFAYEAESLVGEKVELLLPQSFRKRHVKHRQNYNTNPIPRAMGANLELYGLRKDGTQFPIQISLSHTKMDDGLYVIAYISDDTVQKEMLTDLRDHKQKLNEAQKDLELKIQARTKELKESEAKLTIALENEKELGELKSRFVSMASHEFRTPLSSILSSADLISRYEKEDQQEKRMKHVNRIESSVKNLTSILNDFLSLEKLESGKVRYNPIEIHLPEYIKEIVEEVSLTKKRGQTVTYQLDGGDTIRTDEHLVKNILLNLLSNAIKYSPENKEIILSVQNEPSSIKIQVRDSGIGIPEEDQKHLFTRFFRANNASTIQGTGLGLTIIKRYLDLMEGNIHFTSIEGEGTTFFLEIPQ